jgi:hypothetical protein
MTPLIMNISSTFSYYSFISPGSNPMAFQRSGPVFDPRPVNAGFVVGKMTMAQVIF